MHIYKQIALSLPFLFCSQLSLADWINDSAQNVEAHTIKLRQHIHQHPELGNMEFKTSELVQKELKSYGIEVRKGYAKTGVIGILKGAKPGPVMALRADMDGYINGYLNAQEQALYNANRAKGLLCIANAK